MSACDVVGAVFWTFCSIIGAAVLFDPETRGGGALLAALVETPLVLAAIYCIHRVLA